MFYFRPKLPWWQRLLRLVPGALVAIAATVLQAHGVMRRRAAAAAATSMRTAVVGVCSARSMSARRTVGALS